MSLVEGRLNVSAIADEDSQRGLEILPSFPKLPRFVAAV
jgi:hypothetical protein